VKPDEIFVLVLVAICVAAIVVMRAGSKGQRS
jgi:hypothetical protein